MTPSPPRTWSEPGSLWLRAVPLAEVLGYRAGRRPAGSTLRLHPDYPMSDTLDAMMMLLGAYEAMPYPGPAEPAWWIHQIVVGDLVVGDIGFHGPPGDARPRTVEIGYCVVPGWRGRGVATRACELALAVGWVAGADQIVAETDSTNFASQRVLLANGLRPGVDGVFRIGRPSS